MPQKSQKKRASEAGKGSAPRPLSVPREVYEENFKFTFYKGINGKQTRKKNRAV